MDTAQYDFIIVGGGAFGISTTYALIRQYPTTKIALYTGTHECTASKDPIKIIRTAYPDADTTMLANEAMNLWKSEHPYRQYYHDSSWVQIRSGNETKNIYKLPTDQNISHKALMEQTKSSHQPKLEDDEKLWLNRSVGYVDSALVISRLIVMLNALGVIIMHHNIDKLVKSESGSCCGVSVAGQCIRAKNTVLSAGAWTPQILKTSGIRLFDEDMNYLRVTAVAVATLSLNEIESKEWGHMPIVVTTNGEVMPSKANDDNCVVLKITTTKTFLADDLGKLSHKPVDTSANSDILKKVFPQFAYKELEAWYCPDLVTCDQYPVIDEAPENPGLYIATGGSYHSFKFLPNLGALVARRLARGQAQANDHYKDRFLRRCRLRRQAHVSLHQSVYPK